MKDIERPAVCFVCGVRAKQDQGEHTSCRNGHNQWVREFDVANSTLKFWDSAKKAQMSVEYYIAEFYMTDNDIPWEMV